MYLNVYTPDLRPVRPLPVMVWIHGGAFMSGNGNDDVYGPEFLVRHGVILVTLNYRLEVLGFLCLDSVEVPGNAGMKDQVAALRWVKNNIRYFGGDPGNITIFGESAGGASVSYHLISPMSKGLFKRAITQSGSANCPWTQTYEPRERALKLAKELGFHSENDKELYEYFKKVPVEWLALRKTPITAAESVKEQWRIDFVIVNEKKFGSNERFFDGDISNALRNQIHDGVEVMAGYTEDEGILGFTGLDEEKLLHQLNNFVDYLIPKSIAMNCTIVEQSEMSRSLKKFYFGEGVVTKEHFKELTRYFSMEMFIFDIIQWAKFCAKSKNNVYLYRFGCKSERNIFSSVLGAKNYLNKNPVVCHADDLPYIFPIKLLPPNLKANQDSDTFKLIDIVTKLWTNFAKYG